MKFSQTIFVLILSGVFLISCSNDTIDPSFDRVGYSYIPLDSGSYRDYVIDQVTFVITGDSIVENFLLREQVVDYFINAEDDTSFVLHRFTRLSDTLSWNLDSVWTARKTSTQVVVVENNVPLIKLGIPVQEGLEWNGNSLNALEEEIYRIEGLGEAFQTDLLNFNNTLQIIQSDVQDSIVQFDQRSELYALGVGLVLREMLVLNYCTKPDCLGQQIVDSGVRFRQELINYGP